MSEDDAPLDITMATDENRADPVFMLAAITEDPNNTPRASDALRNNAEFMLKAMRAQTNSENEVRVFGCASPALLRADRPFLRDAMRIMGGATITAQHSWLLSAAQNELGLARAFNGLQDGDVVRVAEEALREWTVTQSQVLNARRPSFLSTKTVKPAARRWAFAPDPEAASNGPDPDRAQYTTGCGPIAYGDLENGYYCFSDPSSPDCMVIGCKDPNRDLQFTVSLYRGARLASEGATSNDDEIRPECALIWVTPAHIVYYNACADLWDGNPIDPGTPLSLIGLDVPDDLWPVPRFFHFKFLERYWDEGGLPHHVYYCCREDTTTQHIFDLSSHDAIAISNGNAHYHTLVDYHDFDEVDTLVREATADEESRLKRCRAKDYTYPLARTAARITTQDTVRLLAYAASPDQLLNFATPLNEHHGLAGIEYWELKVSGNLGARAELKFGIAPPEWPCDGRTEMKVGDKTFVCRAGENHTVELIEVPTDEEETILAVCTWDRDKRAWDITDVSGDLPVAGVTEFVKWMAPPPEWPCDGRTEMKVGDTTFVCRAGENNTVNLIEVPTDEEETILAVCTWNRDKRAWDFVTVSGDLPVAGVTEFVKWMAPPSSAQRAASPYMFNVPRPRPTPSNWQRKMQMTVDTERAKFHRTGYAGTDDHRWLIEQPDGYYCQLEWDNPPYPGGCYIFHKVGGSIDNYFIGLFDQDTEYRLTRWEDDGEGKSRYLKDWSNKFSKAIEGNLPGVYCCATDAQIAFYKNVKGAYDEALKQDPDLADSDVWNCDHVDGYGAEIYLDTSFYESEAVDCWDAMGFRDDEEPVFYSCRNDNLTKHIFDVKARDCITCSPAEVAYNANTDYGNFTFTGNDLVRLATDGEKEWLKQCRRTGTIKDPKKPRTKTWGMLLIHGYGSGTLTVYADGELVRQYEDITYKSRLVPCVSASNAQGATVTISCPDQIAPLRTELTNTDMHDILCVRFTEHREQDDGQSAPKFKLLRWRRYVMDYTLSNLRWVKNELAAFRKQWGSVASNVHREIPNRNLMRLGPGGRVFSFMSPIIFGAAHTPRSNVVTAFTKLVDKLGLVHICTDTSSPADVPPVPHGDYGTLRVLNNEKGGSQVGMLKIIGRLIKRMCTDTEYVYDHTYCISVNGESAHAAHAVGPLEEIVERVEGIQQKKNVMSPEITAKDALLFWDGSTCHPVMPESDVRVLPLRPCVFACSFSFAVTAPRAEIDKLVTAIDSCLRADIPGARSTYEYVGDWTYATFFRSVLDELAEYSPRRSKRRRTFRAGGGGGGAAATKIRTLLGTVGITADQCATLSNRGYRTVEDLVALYEKDGSQGFATRLSSDDIRVLSPQKIENLQKVVEDHIAARDNSAAPMVESSGEDTDDSSDYDSFDSDSPGGEHVEVRNGIRFPAVEKMLLRRDRVVRNAGGIHFPAVEKMLLRRDRGLDPAAFKKLLIDEIEKEPLSSKQKRQIFKAVTKAHRASEAKSKPLIVRIEAPVRSFNRKHSDRDLPFKTVLAQFCVDDAARVSLDADVGTLTKHNIFTLGQWVDACRPDKKLPVELVELHLINQAVDVGDNTKFVNDESVTMQIGEELQSYHVGIALFTHQNDVCKKLSQYVAELFELSDLRKTWKPRADVLRSGYYAAESRAYDQRAPKCSRLLLPIHIPGHVLFGIVTLRHFAMHTVRESFALVDSNYYGQDMHSWDHVHECKTLWTAVCKAGISPTTPCFTATGLMKLQDPGFVGNPLVGRTNGECWNNMVLLIMLVIHNRWTSGAQIQAYCNHPEGNKTKTFYAVYRYLYHSLLEVEATVSGVMYISDATLHNHWIDLAELEADPNVWHAYKRAAAEAAKPKKTPGRLGITPEDAIVVSSDSDEYARIIQGGQHNVPFKTFVKLALRVCADLPWFDHENRASMDAQLEELERAMEVRMEIENRLPRIRVTVEAVVAHLTTFNGNLGVKSAVVALILLFRLLPPVEALNAPAAAALSEPEDWSEIRSRPDGAQRRFTLGNIVNACMFRVSPLLLKSEALPVDAPCTFALSALLDAVYRRIPTVEANDERTFVTKTTSGRISLMDGSDIESVVCASTLPVDHCRSGGDCNGRAVKKVADANTTNIYYLDTSVSESYTLIFSFSRTAALPTTCRIWRYQTHMRHQIPSFLLSVLKQGNTAYANDITRGGGGAKESRGGKRKGEEKEGRELKRNAGGGGGDALQFAPDTAKKDKKVVLAAVANTGTALQFASDGLKDDEDVVLAAVKTNGFALRFASNDMKKNKKVVLAAVKTDGFALRFASDDMKKDKEVVLAAVKANGVALHCASNELKKDKEVVLAAVKTNGEALQFASDEMKANLVVVTAAVENTPHLLLVDPPIVKPIAKAICGIQSPQNPGIPLNQISANVGNPLYISHDDGTTAYAFYDRTAGVYVAEPFITDHFVIFGGDAEAIATYIRNSSDDEDVFLPLDRWKAHVRPAAEENPVEDTEERIIVLNSQALELVDMPGPMQEAWKKKVLKLSDKFQEGITKLHALSTARAGPPPLVTIDEDATNPMATLTFDITFRFNLKNRLVLERLIMLARSLRVMLQTGDTDIDDEILDRIVNTTRFELK